MEENEEERIADISLLVAASITLAISLISGVLETRAFFFSWNRMESGSGRTRTMEMDTSPFRYREQSSIWDTGENDRSDDGSQVVQVKIHGRGIPTRAPPFATKASIESILMLILRYSLLVTITMRIIIFSLFLQSDPSLSLLAYAQFFGNIGLTYSYSILNLLWRSLISFLNGLPRYLCHVLLFIIICNMVGNTCTSILLNFKWFPDWTDNQLIEIMFIQLIIGSSSLAVFLILTFGLIRILIGSSSKINRSLTKSIMTVALKKIGVVGILGSVGFFIILGYYFDAIIHGKSNEFLLGEEPTGITYYVTVEIFNVLLPAVTLVVIFWSSKLTSPTLSFPSSSFSSTSDVETAERNRIDPNILPIREPLLSHMGNTYESRSTHYSVSSSSAPARQLLVSNFPAMGHGYVYHPVRGGKPFTSSVSTISSGDSGTTP